MEINKIFNKFYTQNKILWLNTTNLFNFFIFIVYKDIFINPKYKKEYKIKIIINIKSFNKIVEKNNYLILL